MAKLLKDSHGRQVKKLRVSLLDACNMKCLYCMPEDTQFLEKSKWLTPNEIHRVCEVLCDQGLEEIRLTGGEPTLRPDFLQITEALSTLPLKKLAITTNGTRLDKYLEPLHQMSCDHINISLDSLNEDKFYEITKRNELTKILGQIFKARDLGMKIKINTVLLRGINDDEIFDFIEFSKCEGIEVRFLELMKIGVAYWRHPERFLAAGEVLAQIQKKHSLNEVAQAFDSTSFNFTTNHGAQIGFIASETRPFCTGCSRLRLSPEGFLRACLMSSDGLSLKGLSEQEIRIRLNQVIEMKPTSRISHTVDDMHQIGG